LRQVFDRDDALCTIIEVVKCYAGTDAIMATLGEYDAPWDGTLTPEIVDAELYDCPREGLWATSILPPPLCYHNDPCLIQMAARYEALLTLIEVVKVHVENSLDAPLFYEEVDGELYDCPLSDDTWFDLLYPDCDWPSVESLR
jgi:hypothetical protein